MPTPPDDDPAATADTATLVQQAIDVLTLLARQTRTRGAGTPAAATEPVDFADLAAHVLTAVAANLGSVETLLAGRPGSWEADLVRRLVDGTAGQDGDLIHWRTDPIRIAFNAGDILSDLGIGSMFDEEIDQATERTHAEMTDAERSTAEDFVDAIDQLWEQDQTAYAAAYAATAQRYLTEHRATCSVELVTGVLEWDGLADLVEEYARSNTSLPMTGTAPDWTGPVDALRRAGLTYTARAQAAGPSGDGTPDGPHEDDTPEPS